MPLRKKRPSLSAKGPVVEAEFPTNVEDDSPLSTPFSTPRKPSKKAATAGDKDSVEGQAQGGSPLRRRLSSLSSSPSHLKSVVAKKVKRSIQRLDEALHSVSESLPRPKPRPTPPATPEKLGKTRRDQPRSRRVSDGMAVIFPTATFGFPPVTVIQSFPSSSISSRSSSSTSPPTRPRTNSSPKNERGYFEKRYLEIEDRALRQRTTSCPVVPTLVEPPQIGPQMTAAQHAVNSLMALSEEQGPFVEPEVPDPFLVDDEGDALSEEEEETESSGSTSDSRNVASPAAVPVSLSSGLSPIPTSTRTLPSASMMSPNLNKDVPPPPVHDLDDVEDDVPDLVLPDLVIPSMFLPIPNTDPLTTLVNKYIYPPEKRPTRDLSGEWQNTDFSTLVMTNSWRALAKMARDRIVTSSPEDVNLVLGLWYLRLSCLARLRLFNQTAAECTNLFSVLNAVEPIETREYLFEHVLPFELEVMHARLKYWSSDHMGYLDALSALLNRCKVKARQAKGDESVSGVWKERGARVVLIIASQLVEMKEYVAAARLLEPLCQQPGVSNPALRSAVARIYLQLGNLPTAEKHFAIAAGDPTVGERQKQMDAALLASARGDWQNAKETLEGMIEKDDEDYAAVNNLSVALLTQGRLKEAIDVLENALKTSPSTVVLAEPFLFNLSTLYELRSMLGFEKKRQLLVEVAKWSGDGLKTTCLKLPAN